MAADCIEMEMGLVTQTNGSRVGLWLAGAREERLFAVVVKEGMLKLGVWIYLSKTDLETSQIGCVMLVATPPMKVSIWTDTRGIEKTVLVETRVVFSPVEWAKKNDYSWFAYSFEFGRVGNFSFNKLLKLNGGEVKRDVVYKAIVVRMPPSKLGRCIVDIFGLLWSIIPQVLVLCGDQSGFDERPWSAPSSGYQSSVQSIFNNDVSIPPKFIVVDELTSYYTLKNNNPSNEFADEILESLNSSGNCASSASGPNLDQDHCGLSQPVVYLGVVILREPQYSIIWSKMHGFVAVCATADLVLEPSDWVEYDCIETDTELDVSHLAIYCVLSKRKPLVVEIHEKSIICHTVIHVSNGRKVQTDIGGTCFTMACDILGDVLVPDIPVVHRCIRNNELKAKVLIKYDTSEKWPCTLFAVYENDILKIIDWKQTNMECKIIPEVYNTLDLKSTVYESDKPQFLSSDGNVVEVLEPNKNFEKKTQDENKAFIKVHNSPSPDTNTIPNNLLFTEEITYQCSPDNSYVASTVNIKRATEYEEKPGPSGLSYTTSATQKQLSGRDDNFDWSQLKKDIVGMKVLTLPVTILVKLTSTYGILWHVNRKRIIVPVEYLSNSAKLGAWMKVKVSPLDTAVMDLPYRFIVVRPVEEIESKLMIRIVGNILQVRIHLEPGIERCVNINGKFYVQKNSELGLISIPSERLPQEYHMKKFRTWVTFMSSELNSEPEWMITHHQKLVEVDEHGNELPNEFDTNDALAKMTSTSGDSGVSVVNSLCFSEV
ncbi:unnamed protein product [Litomosoides sigmodontis]|uniref:Uncharacterized protein n=1 Tax=Litomosoides sigmodontis TaxID=42156 RepID=A0A3P6VAA5_LITSI|nr:unnamed protein product [Litomosoides sigmodontis]